MSNILLVLAIVGLCVLFAINSHLGSILKEVKEIRIQQEKK
jgi:hypothetical protein